MLELNSGLIDIIEPVAPVLPVAQSWLWLVLLITAVVALVAALLLWWKYKFPAYRTMRRVRELNKQFIAAEHTAHETVLLLALELRHGLALKHLRADSFPQKCSQQDSSRWLEFMQYLDSVLYQHNADLNIEKMATIFAQFEYWLQRYSRHSTLKKIGA